MSKTNWIHVCEYDKMVECVLVGLYFEGAPEGYQHTNFALGIEETKELISKLQQAVEDGEKL